MTLPGEKWPFKKDRLYKVDVCHNCGRLGRLESFTARKWIALGPLPVIPSCYERVTRRCSHCGKKLEFPGEGRQQAVGTLEQTLRLAIWETDYNRVITCAMDLAELGEFSRVEEIVRQLESNGKTDSAQLLRGRLMSAEGKPAAGQLLHAVAQTMPDNPMVHLALAEHALLQQETYEGLRQLEHACRLAPRDTYVRWLLVTLSEFCGETDTQRQTMSELLELQSDLRQDEVFMEKYQALNETKPSPPVPPSSPAGSADRKKRYQPV